MLDPVLTPYVEARDDVDAEDRLTALLDDRLGPLVRVITTRKLRDRALADGGMDAIDDAVAAALLKVVERLTALRATPDTAPIADLDGYTATIAFNVCAELIRARYPERTHLRHRLRYVCEHHADLVTRRSGDGDRRCGLASWPATMAAVEASVVRRLVEQQSPLLQLSTVDTPDALAATIRPLLVHLGAPIEVDLLGAALADANRLDRRAALHEVAAIPETRPGADLVAERRDELRHVWATVRTLPLRQRAALLLHLRGADGAPILWVLPVSGVATIREIATALDLAPTDLAGLWKDLPLSDLAIAERLGCTRQQVINLRVSARRRLLRGRDARPHNLDGLSPSLDGRT